MVKLINEFFMRVTAGQVPEIAKATAVGIDKGTVLVVDHVGTGAGLNLRLKGHFSGTRSFRIIHVGVMLV